MAKKKTDERREYTARRRLSIPGAGVFKCGERCSLTGDQYAADANSLTPVEPPPEPPPPNDGDGDGPPNANRDRMDTDLETR